MRTAKFQGNLFGGAFLHDRSLPLSFSTHTQPLRMSERAWYIFQIQQRCNGQIMETQLQLHLHHSIIQYRSMSLQFLSFDHHLPPYLSNNISQAMGIPTNRKLPREVPVLLAHTEISWQILRRRWGSKSVKQH